MKRYAATAAIAGFSILVLGTGIAIAQNDPGDTPPPTTTSLPPAEIIDAYVQESPELPAGPRLEEAPSTTQPTLAPVIAQPLATPPPAVVDLPVAIEEAPTPTPVSDAPRTTTGELPACPEVTYDGINPPVWSTEDGLPPTYDCNGPGHRDLPQ